MNRLFSLACLLMALRTGIAIPAELRRPTADELARAVVPVYLGLDTAEQSDEPAALPSPTPSPTPAAGETVPEPMPSPAPTAVPETPAPTPAPTSTPDPAPLDMGVTVTSYTDGADRAERLLNYTELSEDWVALASEPLTQRLPAEGVQILIVHTHGTEAYTPDETHVYEPTDAYRTTEEGYNVVHLGDLLAEALTAQGLRVLHLRDYCDYPGYSGSYTRSQALVEQALAENPGIAMVIDLHRDAIGDEEEIYRTVTTVEGRDCAQLMFVVGTGENGLEHPAWRENLKLALALTGASDALYPNLFRPIHLVGERYNQHLSAGALLLEVGTTGNTLPEAERAIGYFADAVGPLLSSLTETAPETELP